MTIAIKIGDDTSAVRGLLYFDVVTNFSESRNGSVTSFPLDFGASVGDHFIAKNPTYKLKGLLSAVDISGVSSKVVIDGATPMNAKDQPAIPSVLDFAVGTAKLLPGSLSQFFKSAIPTIVDGGSSTPSHDQVRDMLREVMNGVQYSSTLKRYQNKMTTLVLYELDGANIKTQHKDLVLTSFDVDEDADTGDCIPLSMSFEKIRFVTVEKVAPKSKAATKKTAKKGVKKPAIKDCKTANSPYQMKGIPQDPKMLTSSAPSFNQLRLRGVLD
jgi:hypothetical protein